MARRRALSTVSGTKPIKGGQAEVDLSEEEVTTTESQQVLKIRSLLKKPNTYDEDVHRFRAAVAIDRKQSKTLLDQKIQEAGEQAVRRRNDITAAILDALQTPNRRVQSEATRATFPGTAIAENTTYIPVAEVLRASDDLSKEYERLNGMITDIDAEHMEPIAETWQQELHDIERHLQMGARVALRNVKKVLGADMDNGKGADKEGLELDPTGGEAKHELNYELQKSLRYAERGVKRMVKGLPHEEQH